MDSIIEPFVLPGDDVDSAAHKEVQRINLGHYKKESRAKLSKFGLCWNCGHLVYRITKYGKEFCVCRGYERPDTPLDASDPVTACSDHTDKFAMPLTMMLGMAKLIDVEGPKKAGFINGDEEA